MNSMKTRLAGVGVALVAAAVPLGMAAPAQATVTHDGCTLTAQTPSFRGLNSSGRELVNYPYTLVCLPAPNGGSISVEVEITTHEQDLAGRFGDVDADNVNNPDDEYIGRAVTTIPFGSLGGVVARTVVGVNPLTDSDDNDEVYSKIRFRVTSGLVTGSWSGDEFSTPAPIFW